MKTPKTTKTPEQIDTERAAYKTLIPDWPVGSTVRVVRTAETHEAGWGNSWAPAMVGAGEFKILTKDRGAGFGLEDGVADFQYPWFVLELVSLPEEPAKPLESWVNVYPDGAIWAYATEKQARERVGCSAIRVAVRMVEAPDQD
jgi:hypothetical protein